MKSKECYKYLYMYNKITDDNLKKRVQISLEYYIRKANYYKHLGNILSIVGIILPSIATYLASLDVPGHWLALITAGTAIVSGIMALFKCSDKKTSYRNSAENLKSELSSFSCSSGQYSEALNPERLLSENVERILKECYDRISALENDDRNNTISENGTNARAD